MWPEDAGYDERQLRIIAEARRAKDEFHERMKDRRVWQPPIYHTPDDLNQYIPTGTFSYPYRPAGDT